MREEGGAEALTHLDARRALFGTEYQLPREADVEEEEVQDAQPEDEGNAGGRGVVVLPQNPAGGYGVQHKRRHACTAPFLGSFARDGNETGPAC